MIGRINETQSTIASAVEEQTATTNEISRSVQDAAKGASGVASTIQRVAVAAKDSSSGSAEALSAAEELSDLAGHLRSVVGRFATSG